MKKYKNSIFYTSVILVLGFIIYWITIEGKKLEVNVEGIVSYNSSWQDFLEAMSHNFQHPLAILLFQIITIVLTARIFGWLFKKIGQPSVIGEIIAGIALGPSFVGMYFPEISSLIFPVDSLGNLQFLSQIGLILFMFVIGMELDLNVLKSKANDAVIISHASIIFPFALGMALAYYTYSAFAPAGVNFVSFGLFMGIAMSITAFPVLARIVQERGIHKTRVGTVVITAAAADDITAWCLLAAVIAIVKAGSFVSAIYVIILAALYVVAMLRLVRPFLNRVGELSISKGGLSKTDVAIFLLTLIVSSYCTEIIGIHALFGAFMTGAVMPVNERFRYMFIEKVEDVSVTLLLPLFFVYTGLRTEIGLINDAYLWKVTGLIVLVAVVGKFVGSAFAAKFVGQNWKDSLTIGALMNTRGLMELVVLNIGFDLGVLTGEVFAMMVIMALVTTFMTGPSLDIINKLFKDKDDADINPVSSKNKFKLLFSFGNPVQGKKLLRIGDALSKKQTGNSEITGMLFGTSEDVFSFEDSYEAENLTPIIEESQALNRKIFTMFKISSDIESDIVEISNSKNYDLLLVSASESIYHGTLLGRVLGFTTRIIKPDILIDTFRGKENIFDNTPLDENTRHILTNVKIPVGVFLDKNLTKIDNIILPVYSKEDIFLMEFAQKLIHNNDSQLIIVDMAHQVQNNYTLKELIRSIDQVKPDHITLTGKTEVTMEILEKQDLVLISQESWKRLQDARKKWTKYLPSMLIVKS